MTFRDLLTGAQKLGISRLSFGVDDACVEALVRAGASVTRTVVARAGAQPYVVEQARLECNGLVAYARRAPQPATPNEVRALESDQAWFYLGDYKAVELPLAE